MIIMTNKYYVFSSDFQNHKLHRNDKITTYSFITQIKLSLGEYIYIYIYIYIYNTFAPFEFYFY